MAELKQNWQDLFKNFRISLDVWKIVLAFLGLLLSFVGGVLLWQMSDVVQWKSLPTGAGAAGETIDIATVAMPLGRLIVLCLAAAIVFYAIVRTCVKSETGMDAKKIGLLFLSLVGLALLVLLFYHILSTRVVAYVAIGVYLLLVWSIFGGAITRIAGVELASDNRMGMSEALGFASRKANAYFWSVFTPLCAVGFIAIFTTVGGWVAGGGYAGFLHPSLLMLAIFFATVGFFMLVNSLVRGTRNHMLAFLVSLVVSAALWLCLYFLTPLGEAVASWRYLEWVVALLTVLFLLAGFLMVLILIGVVFGFPMMFPAVSVEGSDSFDAVSRTYSYLYGKPWRYILYQILGMGYIAACFFFVSRFALAMVSVAGRTVRFGMQGAVQFLVMGDQVQAVEQYLILGDRVKAIVKPVYDAVVGFFEAGAELIAGIGAPDFIVSMYRHVFVPGKLSLAVEAGGVPLHQQVAGVIVAIFLYVLLGVVLSYLVCLVFSVHTTIYMLMRKAVDGTAMTEVYQEEKPEEEKLEEAPPEEAPAAEEEAEAGAEVEKPAPKKKTSRRKVTRRRTSTRPRRTRPSSES